VYQLSQLVDEPTRVTENSATLIVIILTNRPENILRSGVIHLGFSDHSLIFAVRQFKLQKFSATTKKVRNFKHFSVDDFRSDLLKVPWDMIFTLYNPNACWILWKSFFDEILNRHAPLCNKRVRSRQSRWITPAIKQLMRNRNFHKKAIKFNSRYQWSKYQNLRNKVNIEMKLAKSHFYQCEFQNCSRSSDLKKPGR
jgi:hypothetical protein